MEDITYAIQANARRLALILRHRPILKCPLCKGAGGNVSGGEEPEWSECYCYFNWNWLEDAGLKWFVGRVPIWFWIRTKVSIRFGLWYPARLRDLMRCKMGVHQWMAEDALPGGRMCCVCYHSKEIDAARSK